MRSLYFRTYRHYILGWLCFQELVGQLNPGVTGKDVIITLCGLLNNDEVLNHAIEFSGDGVSRLSVDERFTIANMTTEWGALAGVFPVDNTTVKWLQDRLTFHQKRGLAGVPSDGQTDAEVNPRCDADQLKALLADIDEMQPDPECHYATTIALDLSSVRPHVSGPNDVKRATPINELARDKIKINKAYLSIPTNHRPHDYTNKRLTTVHFYS